MIKGRERLDPISSVFWWQSLNHMNPQGPQRPVCNLSVQATLICSIWSSINTPAWQGLPQHPEYGIKELRERPLLDPAPVVPC